MEIEAEILAHYARGAEHSRLTARPSLELLRTKLLLERFLPPAPARVLDVGGGTGVYASWLAGRCYQVHLIDPVPLHVEQAAAAGGFTVARGDARTLAEPVGSYDAALLLGPLYHLTERADRLAALAGACRSVRSGGIVAAAVISRHASMFDGFFRGFLAKPGFAAMMTEDLRTGQHRNPTALPELFTTAYFHDRDGIAAEVTESGLRCRPCCRSKARCTGHPGFRTASPTPLSATSSCVRSPPWKATRPSPELPHTCSPSASAPEAG